VEEQKALGTNQNANNGNNCNYWSVRLDERTGQAVEQPRRLTNWYGFCINSMGATADGTRLAFLEFTKHATVYVTDLKAGGSPVLNLRHFTLDENFNSPQTWTPDSKAVLFSSVRAGDFAIFKQSLNAEAPDLIVAGATGFREARVSPDGKWIMAFIYPKPGGPSDPEQLTRVPIGGGPVELTLTARLESQISCATSSSAVCVLAEPSEDRKQAIVSTLDPVKGRGAELTRLEIAWNEGQWCCEISPDGSTLLAYTGPDVQWHIFSLRGKLLHGIRVKDLNLQADASWAPDGRGLYVFNGVKVGTVLLYVDLQGHTRTLLENYGANLTYAIASPDGRYLAITGGPTTGNMWLMENF
jgi:Tol biopolymer transport system component